MLQCKDTKNLVILWDLSIIESSFSNTLFSTKFIAYMSGKVLLFGIDRPDDVGRAPRHHHIVGHVLVDHAASRHDSVLADGDARQHFHVGTESGVALHHDGLGEQRVTRGGVFGMVFSGQHAVRTDEDAVLNGDAADG